MILRTASWCQSEEDHVFWGAGVWGTQIVGQSHFHVPRQGTELIERQRRRSSDGSDEVL